MAHRHPNLFVIPAKAGIHRAIATRVDGCLDSRLRGNDEKKN
jgi:hypothetical protein